MTDDTRPRLFIRQAEMGDVDALRALSVAIYGESFACTAEHFRGQIANWPDGQFVAVYDGKVVGHCSTFRTTAEIALRAHTWAEITGNGFGSRHNPNGELLYGLDVGVDPAYRRFRVGQRLYNERKKLCRSLGLKGIVFGGRLPGLAGRIRRVGTPERYVEMVKEGALRDSVLSFQLRNGFELLGVLHDYLPGDRESLDNAAHLVWWNQAAVEAEGEADGVTPPRVTDMVRVACIQFQQRSVQSFDEFARNVAYFVETVADYNADFVVFPELYTLQLLSIENRDMPAHEAFSALNKFTPQLDEFLSDLAVRRNINIIGGSHPEIDDQGRALNVCRVYLRDGSVHERAKLHPTPNERYWWRVEGGETAAAIQTDCGPIGVMVCYDSEFPEMARHLIDQGAQILFVPFMTDERQSYLRVRYSCQARAIENQCYVAMAGNVGNLPDVENADIHYAQSCILTPCDFPFARDGVAADTTPNVEMVAFADLSLTALKEARHSGTVRNLADRRFDLYHLRWRR